MSQIFHLIADFVPGITHRLHRSVGHTDHPVGGRLLVVEKVIDIVEDIVQIPANFLHVRFENLYGLRFAVGEFVHRLQNCVLSLTRLFQILCFRLLYLCDCFLPCTNAFVDTSEKFYPHVSYLAGGRTTHLYP